MNIRTMTTEERERLAYAEGFTETAKLLAQLDDAERERDTLEERLENAAAPVRYFVIDYDLEDGPEAIEVREYEFTQAEGSITYERHTLFENGVDQICLTKGLDLWLDL